MSVPNFSRTNRRNARAVSLGPVSLAPRRKAQRPAIEGGSEATFSHATELAFGEAVDYEAIHSSVSSTGGDEFIAPAKHSASGARAQRNALACSSKVEASLTAKAPGASTLSVFTWPSTTSME